MFTWPILPNLPDVRMDGYNNRLHQRLAQLFSEYSKVGRQLQNPPTCRRTKDAAQVIADDAAAKVTFAGTTAWDTHGYWDATNNKYVPLDFTGYYRVSAKVSFAPQTVTTASRRVAIYKNNAEYSSVVLPQESTLRLVVQVADLVYLDGAADQIDIYVICGEACEIEAEAYRTSFAIEYVGADQLL